MGWMEEGRGGFSINGGQDGHFSTMAINYGDESFRRPSAIEIGGTKRRIVIPFEAISSNELYLPSQVWSTLPPPPPSPVCRLVRRPVFRAACLSPSSLGRFQPLESWSQRLCPSTEQRHRPTRNLPVV